MAGGCTWYGEDGPGCSGASSGSKSTCGACTGCQNPDGLNCNADDYTAASCEGTGLNWCGSSPWEFRACDPEARAIRSRIASDPGALAIHKR